MARKPLKPTSQKKYWECAHGCDLTTGIICPHLEALLPHPERGTNKQVALTYTDVIDIYPEDLTAPSIYFEPPSTEDRRKFARRLKRYGLAPHQIHILSDKFLDNKTFAEICEDRGFTSPGIAFYLFREALKLLKLKGFKIHES